MRLPPFPFVVLDTETTGFVPRVHRVIEFASAFYEGGALKEEYEQLLACDEIPPHVEVLTRIKTEQLNGQPTMEEKREEILRHLPADAVIVGQNVLFDLGMLRGEGIDLFDRPWIDTSMLASLVFPELESYSLGYLSAVLHLNHNPPHRALGDVRATAELLSACWERMLELSGSELAAARAIMEKSTPGYRLFFGALPENTRTESPSWMRAQRPVAEPPAHDVMSAVRLPPTGDVSLVEEPLDPSYVLSLVSACTADLSVTHWIAVKNLRSLTRRLPASLKNHAELRILYPARFLLDPASADGLLRQEEFTADEATLAVKIRWYTPATRNDLPLHGGEDAVWGGKVGCAPTSTTYLQQFEDLPSVVLLEHRDLLVFLEDQDHPARKAMARNPHVIIDDASMLEDTATKAYGWMTPLDDLRAAATGHALLTKFLDTLQLWVERTRQFQDLRYLSDADLRGPDAAGLRILLGEVRGKNGWSEQTRRFLQHLGKILDPENLPHRIAWIEQRPNGNQLLHSVPDRVGQFLADQLFKTVPTTLLIPPGTEEKLPEILSPGIHAAVAEDRFTSAACFVPLSFESTPALEDILRDPPPGKTIILLPGRGMIEDLYVKYTEALEARGITLICQGLNGGQGRMQAEFLAAPAPALWLLTPWMFEGIELPPCSVDHLLLKTLPFDHPSQPILSRRANHYRDPFSEYSVPRLLHRLFRLLRTFCRLKNGGADVRILDERLYSKKYGKDVRDYLSRFTTSVTQDAVPPPTIAPAKKPAAKKTKKKDDGQMRLF